MNPHVTYESYLSLLQNTSIVMQQAVDNKWPDEMVDDTFKMWILAYVAVQRSCEILKRPYYEPKPWEVPFASKGPRVTFTPGVCKVAVPITGTDKQYFVNFDMERVNDSQRRVLERVDKSKNK